MTKLEAHKGSASEEKLTPIDKFFVVQKGAIPEVNLRGWSLVVDGSVERPLSLAYGDLLALPMVSEVVTLECFDNVPGGELIGTAEWRGIRVSTILDKAGVKDSAVKVLFHGADGYSTSHKIGYVLRGDVILALKMNGFDLPREHGFPLRLVAPGKYGYKWAKWITRIELVDHDEKGYWESRGYSDEADRKS